LDTELTTLQHKAFWNIMISEMDVFIGTNCEDERWMSLAHHRSSVVGFDDSGFEL
jgi:hypothetical protein